MLFGETGARHACEEYVGKKRMVDWEWPKWRVGLLRCSMNASASIENVRGSLLYKNQQANWCRLPTVAIS